MRGLVKAFDSIVNSSLHRCLIGYIREKQRNATDGIIENYKLDSDITTHKDCGKGVSDNLPWSHPSWSHYS